MAVQQKQDGGQECVSYMRLRTLLSPSGQLYIDLRCLWNHSLSCVLFSSHALEIPGFIKWYPQNKGRQSLVQWAVLSFLELNLNILLQFCCSAFGHMWIGRLGKWCWGRRSPETWKGWLLGKWCTALVIVNTKTLPLLFTPNITCILK